MNRRTKFLLLSIFVGYFIHISEAQNKKEFRFGAKIVPGIDWTRAKSNDISNNGVGVGLSVGAMCDYKLSDNYFLAAEFLFSSMNHSIKLKNDQYLSYNNSHYSNIEYLYQLKYIELPILFKYRSAPKDKLSFWFQGGLAPNILVGNKATMTSSPKDNSPEFPEKGKYVPNSEDNNDLDFDNHYDNIKFGRISMILGAGIEYSLGGRTSFYSGFRLNKGFSDILSDSQSRMINNVFGLELGFFF